MALATGCKTTEAGKRVPDMRSSAESWELPLRPVDGPGSLRLNPTRGVLERRRSAVGTRRRRCRALLAQLTAELVNLLNLRDARAVTLPPVPGKLQLVGPWSSTSCTQPLADRPAGLEWQLNVPRAF